MRILYLNPAAVLGGSERSLLDLMVSVRRCRPEVEIGLVLSANGPLVGQAEALGARVIVLPMPTALAETGDSAWQEGGRLRTLLAIMRRSSAVPATWHYAQQLRRTVAALRPDVIHSNGLKFHLLTRLAHLHPCPVVWHLRDFLSSRPLMACALRWASAHASGAIAISQAVQTDTRTILGTVPTTVIHNGIDTDSFSPGPAPAGWLDRLHGRPSAGRDTIRVGLLATYARWKGQMVFLEAAAQLARTQPGLPVQFYVIGGPIYQTHGSQFSLSELQARAATLGISERIRFLGFQQQPADVYRGLDIVVHASTRPEPFGRTIVEAMACGKPVIVARAGGAAELFTHGLDAWGTTPADAPSLASAIEHVASDAELRKRLGLHARRTAVARFDRRRLGAQVLAMYDQLRVWSWRSGSPSVAGSSHQRQNLIDNMISGS